MRWVSIGSFLCLALLHTGCGDSEDPNPNGPAASGGSTGANGSGATGSASQSGSASSASTSGGGLYVGAFLHRPPDDVLPAYEGFVGRTVDIMGDFFGYGGAFGDWGLIADPNSGNGYMADWAAWLAANPSKRFDVAVPLQPWSGAEGDNPGDLLDEVAAGAHDADFAAWAEAMASHGLLGTESQPIYVRLAWEMDGDFFPHWAGPDSPGYASFAAAWRSAVDAMRAAQPTNHWKFVWCPTFDAYIHSSYGLDWMRTIWPGDDYVDIVGVDIYDVWTPYYPPADATTQQQAWDDYFLPILENMNTFAAEKGKRQGIGEFNVVHLVYEGLEVGGNDNPIFIQGLYDWITTHDFEYAIHFDVDIYSMHYGIFDFSNAAATYIATFGMLPHP